MSAPSVHLIGAGGQLGRVLSARSFAGGAPIGYTSTDVDLADGDSVRRVLAALQPGDVVLNTAAYTDVDGAETDRAGAYAVNAGGPAHLAEVTAAAGARLIHVSTDYVFTGDPGRTAPFEPADLDPRQAPATVYGASKLAGERAAQAADPAATIVRTSWLYTGAAESPDFVGTMRRLEASRPQVMVVDDQRGSPTYVADLADGLVELVEQVWADPSITAGAVLHAAGAGEATWYRLARAVFAGIGADPDRVHPCTTADFPRPAPRPPFSVLGGRSWTAAGLTPLRPWPAALTAALTHRP
ncbi:dTDP-6-deoxy-L-lyxo-4-hexulose reductase [Gordonia hirsuta DSM 44140 = NBRC 16056]|uniref:dTDP-4-dehydrorhamnose reductase n=1 Tax=Gordonia hirsuta DSM 44140 = NBRC 16056 TaxID=1121927 RepID=L7L7L8_9ACTN|nr:dTDP-4-dehydrorhamnose reductase [Gordonia hirsuta]GAC56756.1 dTDP-6-deoxy-L-lyxo-4-hexulose reductase [Gordonia hirsuta DSM 44140 = NBRC 16056]